MTAKYLDNFYARLGISKNASHGDIREAYFSAAKRLHPDANDTPAANELFLQIQEAYTTLSNNKLRSAYDKKLPEDIGAPPDILVNKIYSRKTLPIGSSPQIIYLFLDLMASKETEINLDEKKPPLNISLVLDSSTSMAGKRFQAVKKTATKIVSDLSERDYLSIISFNDHATVIIPASRGLNLSKVDSRIKMMRTKGGTEIFKGLKAGLQEISKNLDPALINHLILITDGRTYGDESQCFQLSEEALQKGITISSLGIGDDWNDSFLDALTSNTGGSSYYAPDSEMIQTSLYKKFDQINLTYANNIKLDITSPNNIDLRYAFRMSPDVSAIEIKNTLELGSVPLGGHLSVMFEFYVPEIKGGSDQIILAEGDLHLSIPNRRIPKSVNKIQFSRPIGENPKVSTPPKILVKALSQLTLYRMQEQAQKNIAAGNLSDATTMLKNLEIKLLNTGNPDLAHTVFLEIEKIKNGNSPSNEAQKQIKYGTRSLVFPQEKK